MKKVALSEAFRTLGECAADMEGDVTLVTRGDEAIAALVPLKDIDAESLSLCTNADFLSLIAKARRESSQGSTLSFEEMREFVDSLSGPDEVSDPTPEGGIYPIQFIVNDRSYAGEYSDRAAAKASVRCEFSVVSKEVSILDADIGRGADWPVFLVSVGIAFDRLFRGERIEDDLDHWLSLARNVKALLARVLLRFGSFRVDQAAAALLVLEAIKAKTEVRSIQQLTAHSFAISPLSRNPRETLAGQPDAVFFIGFRVNDDSLHFYLIKSTGAILFEASFLESDFDLEMRNELIRTRVKSTGKSNS